MKKRKIFNEEKDQINYNEKRNSCGRVDVDDKYLEEVISFVKKRRPRALTSEERMDILLLHAYFRNEHYKNASTNINKNVKAPEVSATISKILKRKSALVKKIWADYVQNQVINVAQLPRNSNGGKFRIPETPHIIKQVRDFILQRRTLGTETFASDVLHFMHVQQFIQYDSSSQKSKKTALRCVQRYLKRKGFRHTSKTNHSYRLSTESYDPGNVFIAQLARHIQNQRRFVYVTKGDLRKIYTSPIDSVYQLEMSSSLPRQDQSYALLAAFLDCDRAIIPANRSQYQQASLVDKSLQIFDTNMNASSLPSYRQYFEQWMQTLLETLSQRGIFNVTILMDDTKLHRKLPARTPNVTWPLSKMIEACQQYQLEIPPDALKFEVWHILKTHIKNTVIPVVSTMARDAGHEVVFIPSHYCDFHPVEAVWKETAGLVGAVAKSTELPELVRKIEIAMKDPKTIKAIETGIENTNKQVLKLYEQLANTRNDELFIDHDDDGNFESSDSESNLESEEDEN